MSLTTILHPRVSRTVRPLGAVFMLLLLLAAGCDDEHQVAPRDRDLALIGSREENAGGTARLVALQRSLLAQLQHGTVDDTLVDDRFRITTPDTLAIGPEHRRMMEFIAHYAQRIPLDTTVLSLAGDLSQYDTFEVLAMSDRQIVVLSRQDEPEAVITTHWHEDAGDWHATSLVVKPARESIDFYRRRAEITRRSQGEPTYVH